MGLWARARSSLDPWVEITKPVNESVASSIVMQNDDHLFFQTVAGKAYEIELCLIYSGAAAGDLRMDFGEDATARGVAWAGHISSGDAALTTSVLANQTAVFTVGTSATPRVAWLHISHVGNGGIWRLRWAQGTSDVTPTVVRAGSRLGYRVVG